MDSSGGGGNPMMMMMMGGAPKVDENSKTKISPASIPETQELYGADKGETDTFVQLELSIKSESTCTEAELNLLFPDPHQFEHIYQITEMKR